VRKPFFWKKRQAWFVKVGKSQIFLSEDEGAAYDKWRSMVSAGLSDLDQSPAPMVAARYIQDGLRGSPGYVERIERYLTEFGNHFLDKPLAISLTTKHVLDWVESRPTWGPSSRRSAIQAVKQAWKWAHDNELLSRNRIKATPMPADGTRQGLITDEQHVLMCNHADRNRVIVNGKRRFRRVLRAVLIALKHTGTRPSMVATVRAEDVAADLSCWVFAKHKTRGKTNKPLVIWLDGCGQTLTRILLAARPKGPLFLNRDGDSWDKDTLGHRIRRLRRRLKLPEAMIAYAYRHSFTTRALTKGVDIATVAELLGHTSTAMISRNYGHLDQAKQHLKDAMKKVNG
jgi:integrase